MKKRFVFLEILDPEVNALILAIVEMASGKVINKPTHLTVRGPYDGYIQNSVLEKCREEMQYDVLRIADIGVFSNPDEEVVYFKVDSSHLRNIWWKPKYGIGEYGFNPHFSLYRGKDKIWANIVAQFLKDEQIELLCAEYRFVRHVTTKQLQLPQTMSKQFSRLIDSKRIHTTFMSRLEKLVNEYRSRNENNYKVTQGLLL